VLSKVVIRSIWATWRQWGKLTYSLNSVEVQIQRTSILPCPFSIIRSLRGSQLDGDVIDALEELMPFIREREVMFHSGWADQPAVTEVGA